MKQVIRWILLLNICICGLLRVVTGIQQLHTDCQTLNTIYSKNLSIKCNKDKVVYVINQLSINSLSKNPTPTTGNNAECQNTTNSTCFRSITSDLSPAFTSKITRYCNGNHSCTLEFSDFNSYGRIFTNSCRCCIDHFYYIRIGVSFECLPSKRQVPFGKNITETGEGFLYLTSNESGRCLIRGSIESARILEQTNMTFTVSDRKSRLCTEVLTNGSFNYNEDLSCLRDLDVLLLDIQTIINTWPRKLWMEFKGTSLQLDCVPSVVRVVQDSEQNGASTFLPVIIGLVAALLLLLALILIVLKRKHARTIKAEAKHRSINPTITLERDQDRTYYNNDVDKPRNDTNDVQGTSSSFDESFYSMANTDANYAQMNIKENASESGRHDGEQNVKKGTDDTEWSHH